MTLHFQTVGLRDHRWEAADSPATETVTPFAAVSGEELTRLVSTAARSMLSAAAEGSESMFAARLYKDTCEALDSGAYRESKGLRHIRR